MKTSKLALMSITYWTPWVPLKVMYPYADVPVLQLSMPTHDPGRLFELGRGFRGQIREYQIRLGLPRVEEFVDGALVADPAADDYRSADVSASSAPGASAASVAAGVSVSPNSRRSAFLLRALPRGVL